MDLSVISGNFGFLMEGFKKTGELAILTMAGGVVGGIGLALGRLTHNRFLHYPAVTIIEFVRGTPVLMLIFWIYFMLPRVTGRSVEANFAGMFALLLFNSAYIAEIVRAGIQAVPVGQVEAAKSTGLNWWHTLRHIILPQAFANMMPALMSQGVMLYKTTSLIYIIGVIDFFRAATIVNNRDFRPYEIFAFVGLVYFIPSAIGSRISRTLESRRLKKQAV